MLPRCCPDAVAALRDESPEIKTYIVGFGESLAGSQQLNAMAEAGGTARTPADPDDPTSPVYYEARSSADLDMMLDLIAGSVLSCNYQLAQEPPDSNDLSVFLDNTPLPRGDADGWDYHADNNQIIFSGAACTQLQSGNVNLKIIFGCPDLIVPVE